MRQYCKRCGVMTAEESTTVPIDLCYNCKTEILIVRSKCCEEIIGEAGVDLRAFIEGQGWDATTEAAALYTGYHVINFITDKLEE